MGTNRCASSSKRCREAGAISVGYHADGRSGAIRSGTHGAPIGTGGGMAGAWNLRLAQRRVILRVAGRKPTYLLNLVAHIDGNVRKAKGVKGRRGAALLPGDGLVLASRPSGALDGGGHL